MLTLVVEPTRRTSLSGASLVTNKYGGGMQLCQTREIGLVGRVQQNQQTGSEQLSFFFFVLGRSLVLLLL
jgi:hypothetical protein